MEGPAGKLGHEAIRVAKSEKPESYSFRYDDARYGRSSTYAKLQEEEDLASTPVIFMTAKVQTHEVENHLKLGGAGVLPNLSTR